MSSANVQDILAFVIFLMASGFSVQKLGNVQRASCSPGCRVSLAKPLLSMCHTGMLVQDKAPTMKMQEFAALAWRLSLTSEVSPTDLLVNCAITRSTNLSVSCHVTNVDCTIGRGCDGPPSLCNGRAEGLAGLFNLDDHLLHRQTGVFEWNGEGV